MCHMLLRNFSYVVCYFVIMMTISFITIKSGLVPLIEGLCAQIIYFRSDIIGGFAFTSFAFLFGRKIF